MNKDLKWTLQKVKDYILSLESECFLLNMTMDWTCGLTENDKKLFQEMDTMSERFKEIINELKERLNEQCNG